MKLSLSKSHLFVAVFFYLFFFSFQATNPCECHVCFVHKAVPIDSGKLRRTFFLPKVTQIF